MARIIFAVTLLAFLGACGGGFRDSRLNPRNWFGRDKEEIVVVSEDVDPRGLVNEVISLKVDRLPEGAIIHAVGLPQTQGYYEAELVPLNDEFPDKGVLIYEFRVFPPQSATGVVNKRSREVLVAHFVSTQSLAGVRRIQVIGISNRRTVRR